MHIFDSSLLLHMQSARICLTALLLAALRIHFTFVDLWIIAACNKTCLAGVRSEFAVQHDDVPDWLCAILPDIQLRADWKVTVSRQLESM